MTKLNAATLRELSTKISSLVGYHLGEDHIHQIEADGTGYHYYIQGLKPGYPVLVMHYRSPLVLLLPFDDGQRLNLGEVSVDGYIESSHFNYGYYWGGGSMIDGGYWQPLEEGTGIHDTERISRYLHILSCRTNKVSSGYGPDEEQCQKCQLDATACPFSPLNQTGSWDNEIQEPDGRVRLFEAIDERLKLELGFEWSIRGLHHGGRRELRLYPGCKPYTVEAQVSGDLLNDLLYHPDQEHDWQQVAEDFVISIRRPFEPDSSVVLPKGSTKDRSMCLEIWHGMNRTEMQSIASKHDVCLAIWSQKVEEWEALRKAESTEESEDSTSDTVETTPDATKGHKFRNAVIAFVKLACGGARR